jgi:hypothetical protein
MKDETRDQQMLEVNSRIESLTRKIELLVALERKVANILAEVLPARQARVADTVPGYDIVPIKSGRKTSWVWKHFVRGSRSPRAYKTRDECFKSAKHDALEQLAYGKPSRDIAAILSSIEKEPVHS